MTTVLVIDDDRDMTKSLCAFLELEGYDCESAYSARTGLAKVRGNGHDIIILDMRMDDVDVPDEYSEYSGMYFLSKVREFTDAPVIVLTGYPAIETAVPALSGGANAVASSYLTKPMVNEDLLSEIQHLLKRLSVDDFRIDLIERTAYYKEQPFDLTGRQFDMLTLFMRHPNTWFTYQDIAYHLDGEELDSRTATDKFKSHMHRLRKTLENVSGYEVIRIATGEQWKASMRKKGGSQLPK